MDLAELEADESRLAEALRKVCTPYGDEKRSRLKESTEALWGLGRVYVQKAAATDGMEQKLNFIKAATLLHGARVRSDNILKNFWDTKIYDSLAEMETVLLNNCSASRPLSLRKISLSILKSFEVARAEERKCIKSLEKISDSHCGSEAHEKRARKIIKVQELLKTNTLFYRKQMQIISEECINILGQPPCYFVIAGLGSLARDEVTLFSDFEHVIIFEDIEPGKEHEKILEYFRWFSIVFHVIIIGMGETIIRSVGVQSLNDLYSVEQKSRNWFYDSFTTSGVSFDGMMPHACKIPVGRQQGTVNRPHIVELIKTVKGMACYLTKEEDVKNGYCLKDVLCETCFVFGSEEVYRQFKTEANRTLAHENACVSESSISRSAKENVNPYVAGRETLPASQVAVDTKAAFYRPLSVLIGYFSRSQGTGDASGFEKIKQLRHIPISHDKNSLLWAFAVACEVRLKAYAADGGNRIRNFGKDLLKYVGKSCLVNCASVIIDSSHFLGSPLLYSLCHEYLDTRTSGLLFIKAYADARKTLLMRIEQTKLEASASNLGYELELAAIYFHEAMLRRTATCLEEQPTTTLMCADLLEKAENILLGVENHQNKPQICHLLSKIYLEQGRGWEAKELSDKIFENIDESGISVVKKMEFMQTQIDASMYCMGQDFISSCQETLSKSNDVVHQLKFGLALAKVQCQFGEKEEARELLTQLTNVCAKEGPKSIPLNVLVKWMQAVFVRQSTEKWYDECVDTLGIFEELTESCREYLNKELAMTFQSIYAYEACIMASLEGERPRSALDKIKLYQKALEICKCRANAEDYKVEYSYALMLITELCFKDNFKQFDIARLCEIFTSAPENIHRDSKVMSFTVYSVMQFHGTLMRDKESGVLDILHKAIFSDRLAGKLHPLLYPGEHFLRVRLKMRLEETFSQSNHPLMQSLLRILNDHPAIIYSTYPQNVRDAMNDLWKSLVMAPGIPKYSFSRFLCYVYHFLCVERYRHFSFCLEMAPYIYSKGIDSGHESEFNDALENYSMLNFECLKAFWGISCRARKGSHLQRLSIKFFCSALNHFFVMELGYKMHFSPLVWQIVVGSHEYFMSVKAEAKELGPLLASRRNALIEALLQNKREEHLADFV